MTPAPPPPPPTKPLGSSSKSAVPAPPSIPQPKSFNSKATKSDSNDRNALLSQIQKGKKLKKATTVDKSKPYIEGNKPVNINPAVSFSSNSTSSALNSAAKNSINSGGGLGGLFKDGMPKLKSRTGNIPVMSNYSERNKVESDSQQSKISSLQNKIESKPTLNTSPSNKFNQNKPQLPKIPPPSIPKKTQDTNINKIINTSTSNKSNTKDDLRLTPFTTNKFNTISESKPPKKPVPKLPPKIPSKSTKESNKDNNAIEHKVPHVTSKTKTQIKQSYNQNNLEDSNKKQNEVPLQIGKYKFISKERFPLPPKDMLDYKIGPYTYPSGRKSGNSISIISHLFKLGIPFDLNRYI